jgi:hypothetical protein
MTDIVAYDQNEGLAVYEQCESIERWAAECDSVPQLRDAGHKLAAIDEYLSRTTTEGRARVAAAMRRLEVRVGVLLGPAEVGRPVRENVDRDRHSDVSRDQRADFRRMAEHPDIVDEVIAKSTDEEPASRRKVTEAIKNKTAKPEKRRRAPLPDFARRSAWELRRSAERMERVVADDRYAANKEQVDAHVRGHLAYTIEVCQDLFNQLDEGP